MNTDLIMTGHLIEYQGISIYKNGSPLFTGFDFSVSPGEKVLILGRSGTGKTTLFRMLLGFETPDSGDVLFNRLPVTKAHIRDIRQQVFYLSQDIDLRHEPVSGLIEEIMEENRLNMPEDDTLDRYITLLELDRGILNQNVKDLSGGERQRTGLLICFLLDRPVWLLDEPTSALDDLMKQKIADYILDRDKTVLVISHDDVWKTNQNMIVREVG